VPPTPPPPPHALSSLGHFDDAETAFLAGLRIDPKNSDVLDNLAEVRSYHEKQGNPRRDLDETVHANTETVEKNKSTKKNQNKTKKSKKKNRKVNSSSSTAAPWIDDIALPPAGTRDDAQPDHADHDPLRYTRKRRVMPAPIPRIHVNDMHKSENIAYLMGTKPFILLGAMDNWDLDYWQAYNLAAQFPESIVDFYPHNMDKVDNHPYLTPMSSAVHEMFQPSGAYPYNSHIPGTYLQWNVNITDWARLRKHMDPMPHSFIRDEEWLDSCLSTDELRQEYTKRVHWRMVLIGTKGAGMFNHIDVLRSSSWQAQVAGAKRWHLCEPDQTPYMYTAGAVDCFYPNYEKTPLFEHAKCFEGIAHAGEMIYYPADTWHQTENHETPSISVSSTMVDHNNFRILTDELKNECGWQKFKWRFSEDLCRELPKCYDFLYDRYDDTIDRGTCGLSREHEEL
jgi:Cupin-like domain